MRPRLDRDSGAARACARQRRGGAPVSGRSGGSLARHGARASGAARDRPPAPRLEAESARFRVFDAVAELRERAAAVEPVALILEDLHAADAPSLLLQRFVAGELAGSRILSVGSYSDSEVGPGRLLAETLLELASEAAVRRIERKGLGAPDTSRLLELTTRQRPPDDLVSRVDAETEGNRCSRGARTAARLGGRTGQGRGPASASDTDGVREAIGRRLRASRSVPAGLSLARSSAGVRRRPLERIGRWSRRRRRGARRGCATVWSARSGTRGRLRFRTC